MTMPNFQATEKNAPAFAPPAHLARFPEALKERTEGVAKH